MCLRISVLTVLVCAFLPASATQLLAEKPDPVLRGLRSPAHKTVSPDQKVYAVWYLNGWDETIAIHDNESGAEKVRISGHGDQVQEFRFTPDGTVLASRSEKGWKLWDVKSGKLLLELLGLEANQRSC
jgi:WD40 repeat protein